MMRFKHIIIGAGPAGLQAAYEFNQKKEEYIVLEKSEKVGKTFEKYPRHGQLISINKANTGCSDSEKNLRWDWNSLLGDDSFKPFTSYTKDYFPKASDLLEYFNDFSKHFKLNVAFNSSVTSIKKNEDDFVILLENGKEYVTHNLIVATGFESTVKPLFEGSEYIQDYSEVSVNAEDFTNRTVLVMGKGNSGFETADHLVSHAAAIHLISPSSIRLAWETHYVGHLRAVNNNILDTYHLKSQNTVIDGKVLSITKLENGRLEVRLKYSHALDQEEIIVVDDVISCTGFRFDDSMFDKESCPIELSDCRKFPRLASNWESTNIKGLYFAGVLMHQRDYRVGFSGFIHGFRYNVRTLVKLILEDEKGTSTKTISLEKNTRILGDHIMERFMRSSSLFLQAGIFCDVYELGEDSVQSYEDLPIDYSKERFDKSNYISISLEYGEKAKMKGVNPFTVERDPSKGDDSYYLHPVIRYYDKGNLVEKHEIPDDLLNNWIQDKYTTPFFSFLEKVLAEESVLAL